MNITVRKGMLAGFAIIFIIVLSITLFTTIESINNDVLISKIDSEILPNTLDFLRLEKDIIQIQQWLTDIAATRGAPGYDDGFSEAEYYHKDAVEILSKLDNAHKNDKDVAAVLSTIRKELDDFYRVGKEMAQVYIDFGPERGNQMMDKFDPYTKSMSANLTKQVAEHLNELESNLIELHATQKTTRMILILASVVSLLIIILITIFLSSTISRGFQKVSIYSDNLAQGIFNNRIEYNRKNEFGILISNFNSSFDSMGALITALKDLSEKDSNLNNNLSASAEEVSAAVSEMDANMNQMNRQIEKQDNVVSDSVSAVNQITSNIKSLTMQIENQSSAVTQSSASVEEMAASINNVARISLERNQLTAELVGKLNTTSSNMSETEAVIKQISELSSNMKNITDVINSIAAQTNLLAMNAAIEAAHAGDAGRGFAVVASEIRKLAEDTGSNAHLINDTLKQITKIVETARETSEENRESFTEVEKSVSGFTETFSEINSSMAELSGGTAEITSAVTSLSDITTQIKSAADEINQGSEYINQSMSDLKELSNSVLGGINESSFAINEISVAMNDLREITRDSRESTETIQREIDRFTV